MQTSFTPLTDVAASGIETIVIAVLGLGAVLLGVLVVAYAVAKILGVLKEEEPTRYGPIGKHDPVGGGGADDWVPQWKHREHARRVVEDDDRPRGVFGSSSVESYSPPGADDPLIGGGGSFDGGGASGDWSDDKAKEGDA